jgi:hypothetical protein
VWCCQVCIPPKDQKGQCGRRQIISMFLHTPTTKPATFLLVLLLARARGPEGHLPGPSMPPVYSTSRWKAKLQSLDLSNLSCSHCNLVVHIPIRSNQVEVQPNLGPTHPPEQVIRGPCTGPIRCLLSAYPHGTLYRM